MKQALRYRKAAEQSENVYENKGRGENNQGLAQTLLLNVHDAPKAQARQFVPLVLACPFGTSQTPNIKGPRHLSTPELSERTGNVYENKGTARQSTTA